MKIYKTDKNLYDPFDKIIEFDGQIVHLYHEYRHYWQHKKFPTISKIDITIRYFYIKLLILSLILSFKYILLYKFLILLLIICGVFTNLVELDANIFAVRRMILKKNRVNYFKIFTYQMTYIFGMILTPIINYMIFLNYLK